MNNEERLIAKIVSEKTLQPVLDRGVTKSWFYDTDARTSYEFITKHYEKYGNVPAKRTFVSHMGKTVKVVAITESFDYLLDQMANHARWTHTRATVEDIADLLNDGLTDDAIAAMETGLVKVRSFSPVATHLVNSMAVERLDERWDAYMTRKTSSGLLGYSTGFPTIDRTTLGLQPGQLITILAQHKVGKTSVSLSIANHVYSTHKVPVLFVTFEMGVSELEMRQESLMAGINFRRLQQGDLTPLQEKTYEDWLAYAEKHYTWPFHFQDISSGGTVSAVESMIEKHSPAVVFIDGIYMMTDEITGGTNDWEAITNITRSLKRLASQRGVPIVINSQALRSKSKGERITSDSAGYSSSFGQDSDVVLGLERIPEAKGDPPGAHDFERLLKILASRNTGLDQTELIFNYDEGQIEEI